MAEKILQTRIQNKVDTLANWNASSLVLKSGEIALATVTVKGADSQYVPTILMKVGDGTKTFSQLPWSSARASDVYDWAKLENPTIAQLPGNLSAAITNLQSAVGDGGNVSETIQNAINALDMTDSAVANQFVTSVSQTNGIISVTRSALTEAMIPALGINKITGLQTALDGKVNNSTYSTDKAAIEGRITATEGDLTTLKGSGTGSVIKTVTDEIAKVVANAPADYDTLKEIADYIASDKTGAAAMNTAISSNTSAIATLNGDATTAGSVAKSVADAESRVANSYETKGTAQGIVDGLGLKSAAFTEASAYATSAQGTLANTAVQQISTTANAGLKVTGKDKIDIDDSVTFVFNCGTSSI